MRTIAFMERRKILSPTAVGRTSVLLSLGSGVRREAQRRLYPGHVPSSIEVATDWMKFMTVLSLQRRDNRETVHRERPGEVWGRELETVLEMTAASGAVGDEWRRWS